MYTDNIFIEVHCELNQSILVFYVDNEQIAEYASGLIIECDKDSIEIEL